MPNYLEKFIRIPDNPNDKYVLTYEESLDKWIAAPVPDCILKSYNVPDSTDVFWWNLDNNQLYSYDPTTGDWVSHIGGGHSMVTGISFTMSDHQNHDYVACGVQTYITIRSFIYGGTLVWKPRKFTIVTSLAKVNGQGYARLYDYTNNNQICELSWTSENKIIVTTDNLSNLSSNQSIVELQLRSKKQGRDVRIHYMALY